MCFAGGAMVGHIRVLVIDDHPLFRAGVVQTLAQDDRIEVVGEGGTRSEAHSLAQTLKPDIVLLDITMPGGGIEAAEELLRLPEPPKVMMLTVSEDNDAVIRALSAGAVGYLLKGIPGATLITAVKAIAAGETFVSPNLGLRLLSQLNEQPSRSRLSSLNDSEKRTLRLVATGLSNREVGERLGIPEKTIKYHMSNIMDKLQVRNRVEATLIAQREWGSEGDL
jgi:DNA-binding NarL/FixJ family response regulator